MKKIIIISATVLIAIAALFLFKHSTIKRIPENAKLVYIMKEGNKMAVVKILNVVGDSTKSWDDAVQSAIEEASKTVDNISGVEVMNQTANVRDGKIVEYKANVQIAFKVDR
ncbi:dodecin domain-containing protein [Aceticella autotrophica]|uniref:Dodecin domain-containing protein n=2 Tax=Aceticella autotrophica TaxID=2755338 RepID=A0A975GBI9_9THEO|nr:dodecin domain-containing protein [Aceticella autotrophica]